MIFRSQKCLFPNVHFRGPNWVGGAWYGIFLIREKPALRAGLINWNILIFAYGRLFNLWKVCSFIYKILGKGFCLEFKKRMLEMFILINQSTWKLLDIICCESDMFMSKTQQKSLSDCYEYYMAGVSRLPEHFSSEKNTMQNSSWWQIYMQTTILKYFHLK